MPLLRFRRPLRDLLGAAVRLPTRFLYSFDAAFRNFFQVPLRPTFVDRRLALRFTIEREK